MFTYQTSTQVIIGLDSIHPIQRMIKEKHFKKALVIFSKDRNAMYNLGRVRKALHRARVSSEFLAADLRRDSIEVVPTVDLIISIGVRHVHDIAKISNTHRASLYCLEAVPGRASSYGTGVVWIKETFKEIKVMPNIVFNSCRGCTPWNISDLVYFLHDIPLAIDACLNKKTNDFIIASGIGGLVEFFRIYDLITKTKSQRKLRKLYIELTYADILMKNAYNNMPLSLETEKIAKATAHYRQFEVAIAADSHDVIDNHLKKNGKRLDELLRKAGSDIVSFEKQFSKIYNDYISHPQQWSFAGDMLGTKLASILGENTKTRRVE